MNSSEFRSELVKAMPGYKWTVHKSRSERVLAATGTQSSGSNRLSTLHIERRDNYASSGRPNYEAKSAGYGTKSPWMHTASGTTLAQALRGLQDHYKRLAQTYRGLESDLQVGRTPKAGAQ